MKQLTRRFSPWNMLLLSINGMIGSAWLFAPLYAAKIAGSGAIIAWLLGGFGTILIALTFAELSTSLPVTGGSTRFSQLSQGMIVGYVISWITWLSSVTMAPIEVQAVLQYSATYFPSLTHLVNSQVVLTHFGLLWATLLMLALCIINVASFKGLIGFNQLLFSFKVLVMVFTIVWLMHTQFISHNFVGAEVSHWSITGWHAILTAVASGGIAFAFTGFKHGVELAGETTRSHLAVPLAIVGSIVVCLILYLGLQIAFIGSLDPAWLVNGWDKLTFHGEAGPFVGVAAALGLVWLVKLLYIDAAVSPLGAGLIYVTSTARIIYAMSKNGYLPAVFTRLNKQHFPIVAIGFNFVIGMLLFLPFPGWQNMVSFLVSAVAISYAMGPIALLSLRRTLPNLKRSFRIPAAEVFCLVAFYFCNLISYWTGWDTIWKLAIAVVIGLIILFIAHCRGKLKTQVLNLRALVWLIPYLLGLVIISYIGSFGGKGWLTFGWDFLVIAIFSLVILWLAVNARLPDVDKQLALYQAES